ncbi:hypothetical protein CLAFUW4_12086 [Fulvia fulva]|uniref:Uncharacterized protein n=1 Tax=Passalora fulva TaxID=5499 RepID=A0A9Q8USE4_PASFU|nr:uncharacterized protein CLAFUR5_11125 [Fulvia fulva]KAK4617543.1 hypothetical protein CLAFUR4_12091 [Fulvia fulva]KAK4618946.1 hypothetical protein CLAFUR0_12102 [Fulvia fulva]UJO20696.1 hypothetical protein CLAFUR5_11125 [Fulvia fulva]WPV18305.1 hypothetical protein CLAFUW4_12086 [Fulvia fulva]WPV32866.1 hypothetical protein CLAFUW7_12093 [Fulvia fulva]
MVVTNTAVSDIKNLLEVSTAIRAKVAANMAYLLIHSARQEYSRLERTAFALKNFPADLFEATKIYAENLRLPSRSQNSAFIFHQWQDPAWMYDFAALYLTHHKIFAVPLSFFMSDTSILANHRRRLVLLYCLACRQSPQEASCLPVHLHLPDWYRRGNRFPQFLSFTACRDAITNEFAGMFSEQFQEAMLNRAT